MPSVLLEVGYLTNPEEEQLMFNDEFQYIIAESICNGIKEYLEIEWYRKEYIKNSSSRKIKQKLFKLWYKCYN